MITQLVYTSQPNFLPASPEGEKHIATILGTARQFNSTHHITGFLLVGPDWFAQVLEGQAAAVSGLFNKLLADSRHRNVKLVDTRLVKERRFSNWSMGVSHGILPDKEIAAMVGDVTTARFSPQHFASIVALAVSQAAMIGEDNALSEFSRRSQ